MAHAAYSSPWQKAVVATSVLQPPRVQVSNRPAVIAGAGARLAADRSKAQAFDADAALVRSARRGERRAQDALFRRHAPLVFGLAHRLLGGDCELEDVAQEACCRAFSSLHRLEDPRAFAAWLAGIVVRCVRQHLRRRSLLTRLGLRSAVPIDPDLSPSPLAPPEVTVELRRLYASLEKAPTEVRLAVLLRRVDGYSLPEIAILLECSLSTVKRRLNKADRALGVRVEERP